MRVGSMTRVMTSCFGRVLPRAAMGLPALIALQSSQRRVVPWSEETLSAAEPSPGICGGCGWKLQSEASEELGYVPEERSLPRPVLDPDEEVDDATMGNAVGAPLCQRCWRLRHHHELVVEAPNQARKLATIKDRLGVVVLLVDLFDVPGTLPRSFGAQVAGSNPVIVVGNKVDLLPAGATEYRLQSWLQRQIPQESMNVSEVRVISSRSGAGMRELLHTIDQRSNSFRKDVFICGKTNVGKSTFLNKMVRMFGGPKGVKLTESWLHGTTIGFIPIPIGNHGRAIYDTPGLLTDSGIRSSMSTADLKITQPTGGSPVRPFVYRLVPGKSLLLGSFARLDFEGGEGYLLFTVFVSPRLLPFIQATSIEKQRPQQDVAQHWTQTQFVIQPSGDHSWERAWADIAFPGIGWVSITGRIGVPIKLVTHSLATPDGFLPPIMREPLMPWEASLTAVRTGDVVVHKHGRVRDSD